MTSVINVPLNLHISSDVNDNLNLSQWQKRENHHSCTQLAVWRSVFVQSYSTAFGVPLHEFLFQCMHKGCGFGSFLFLCAVRKRILLKSYLHSNIHWRNRVVILDFFFAVSIDSIKGFPVIHTSWIKWHTLLVKYSLPEKQKFSFNDKLFVSRYVRRLLTGHHCPQIGEGERGFFRRRREMKVGKSPQASNVCLLSWTMSPASHNSSGSRKRGGGWQRVGEFSRSLRAPPRSAPSPSGSTGGLPHVLPAGTSVSTRHWEHWRKQVPSDSLFPQKRQDENKTRSGKWRGRVELREDVIHG